MASQTGLPIGVERHEEKARCEESEGDDREEKTCPCEAVRLIRAVGAYEVRKRELEAMLLSLVQEYFASLQLDIVVDEQFRVSELDRELLSQSILLQIQAAVQIKKASGLLDTQSCGTGAPSTRMTLLGGGVTAVKSVVAVVTKRVDDAVDAVGPSLTSLIAAVWR